MFKIHINFLTDPQLGGLCQNFLDQFSKNNDLHFILNEFSDKLNHAIGILLLSSLNLFDRELIFVKYVCFHIFITKLAPYNDIL